MVQAELLRRKTSEDEALWQKVLKGNVGAFETLMTTHFGLLFQYGLKFSSDEEFVKDTIQDLFLHVWERRQNLNADIPAIPYLMASLRRMMNRASTTGISYVPSFENHPVLFDVKFCIEKEYIRHESSRLLSYRLNKILDKLPLRQKEAIYLKFYRELTRDQIALVMNISPQTVSNLLQIAMKQLRKHWKANFIHSSNL